MTEKTIKGLTEGGIRDHLGGGFHRYSTDRLWRIPHFEKMLYNQALISLLLIDVYRITGKEEYAVLARETLDYVIRDMMREGGGFFSSEDADSGVNTPDGEKKKEGVYYLWTAEEVDRVTGEGSGIVKTYFGISPEGNAVNDPFGEMAGKNVLYIAKDIENTAAEHGSTTEEVTHIVEEASAKLSNIRKERDRPALDDKVLTDWNGLMISAMAIAGEVFGEVRYTIAAKSAAEFILNDITNAEGGLLHRWREGEASVKGTLDDHAFLINGMIDLYEATFDVEYIKRSDRLAHRMIEQFLDEKEGGFFSAAKDPMLFVRDKEVHDGTIPSGNAAAITALIRLGRITENREYLDFAEKGLRAFSADLRGVPSGHMQMLAALDLFTGPEVDIVIAGDRSLPGFKAMKDMIYGKFMPGSIITYSPDEGPRRKDLEKLIPMIKNRVSADGAPTVYICHDKVCGLPLKSRNTLEAALSSVGKD